MNGAEQLEALATWQQLVLFAFFALGSLMLITIGTWAGNSDLWDKAGEEMGKLNKAVKSAARTIKMAPMLLAHVYLQALTRARALHTGETVYAGRHRLA